jgi:hypothetical protein
MKKLRSKMAWKFRVWSLKFEVCSPENQIIMRRLFPCLLVSFLFYPVLLSSQVFMRPFDNAASLALGGATLAYPGLATGLGNESLLGFGEKRGVYLNSAIPYAISGWQTAQFQGFTKLGLNDGIGLDIAHSGIEVYQEQQFRLLYGRRLGEKFYFGGSAALLRVSAQEYGTANGVSFGLGVLAQALPNLWLGARLQNPFQQKVGDYEAASLLRIGAAWRTSEIFTLLGEVEKSLERTAQVKGGFEYRPVSVLVIRAGARTGGAARVGFGVGIRLKNGLAFDFGSEWHPSLGLTPAAMFVWRRS